MSPLFIRLLLAVAVAASALAFGWWLGAGRVQGKWDAAELQRERGAQVLLAQDRRRVADQAGQFEAQRAALQARATSLSLEPRYELQGPVPCAAGASAVLGDLPVPAAAVDRLRRAGADPSAS